MLLSVPVFVITKSLSSFIENDNWSIEIEEDLKDRYKKYMVRNRLNRRDGSVTESENKKSWGINSYILRLTGAEKIETGVRPSLRSGNLGGRAYVRLDNLNIPFLNREINRTKLELGTDRLDIRMEEPLKNNWHSQLRYRIGSSGKEDLTLGFSKTLEETVKIPGINNYVGTKTIGRKQMSLSLGYSETRFGDYDRNGRGDAKGQAFIGLQYIFLN